MGGAIWKGALIGSACGVGGSAVLFLTSERRTLANDWLLAVMILVASATTFAVAAGYKVSVLGVAIAGTAGLIVGAWVGDHTIGTYEYTVPTPQDDRQMRFIIDGQERVVELKHVPDEMVKRIPFGGRVGGLAGWLIGTGAYVWLRRPRHEEQGTRDQEPEAEPAPPERSSTHRSLTQENGSSTSEQGN